MDIQCLWQAEAVSSDVKGYFDKGFIYLRLLLEGQDFFLRSLIKARSTLVEIHSAFGESSSRSDTSHTYITQYFIIITILFAFWICLQNEHHHTAALVSSFGP